MRKGLIALSLVTALGFWGFVINSEDASAAEMYRLYNANSSEHFYTENKGESDNLRKVGWHYEGIGWIAPNSGSPVYRLYNANAGDHHYTMDTGERDHLISVGWQYENISWLSAEQNDLPLYRLYNPNAVAGAHHYTLDTGERDNLKRAGWKDENVAWYAESRPTYPFAVANNEISGTKNFYISGVNVPNNISTTFTNPSSSANGQVTFKYTDYNGQQNSIVYNATLQQVATKDVRIFSAKDHSIKTNSVNTTIKLGTIVSGEEQQDLVGDLYLQYNDSGSISLITPNYAGNVMPEDTDVMLEYLIQ